MLKYILIGAGALLLLVAVGVGVWLATNHSYLFYRPKYDIVTRDGFVSGWTARPAERFVAVYGPPAKKHYHGPNQEAWTYYGLTYDPVTNQKDGRVEVIIWAGQTVGEIRFP